MPAPMMTYFEEFGGVIVCNGDEFLKDNLIGF